jgi:hypothetical protein
VHTRTRATIAIALCAPLVAACFDLFHATDDIQSLCELDASASDACAQPVVLDAATDASDEPEAAPFNPNDFCASDSTTARGAAERACRLLGACSGPIGENQFGACMVRAILAYDCTTNPDRKPKGAALDFWRCMAAANDCGSADKCTGKAGCTPGEVATACLDSHRTACTGAPDGGFAQVESCAAWGQVCVDNAVGGPSCGGPAKLGPCDASTCVGNTLVGCDPASQNDLGVDCTQFGAGHCLTPQAGPICAPAGPGCADSGVVACNAGVATACLTGALERVNCSTLTLGSGVCVEGQAPSPSWELSSSCFRPGAQCPSPPDTCDGKVLKSCFRGVTYSTVCPNGCNPDIVTPDGTRAACTP